MSKWELQRGNRKPPSPPRTEEPRYEDWCRILPPRLAHTPHIVEYLLSKINRARLEKFTYRAYERRCQELGDLHSIEKFI